MAEQTFSERGYPISVLEQVDEAVTGDAVMVWLLQRHGCVLRGNRILFPAGTLAQEILPRWGWMEKYTLRLPDGLQLGWKLDRSQQPSGSMLLVSREVYEHERHLLTLGQGAVNEHGLVLTIQATLREVLALGVALQSYKLQLERQPSVTPQQQEALELVSMLHDRLVASLSSSSK